jgi:hypothetical protein
MPEPDLALQRVGALAKNNDNRLHVAGHEAGSPQLRSANRR